MPNNCQRKADALSGQRILVESEDESDDEEKAIRYKEGCKHELLPDYMFIRKML